MLKTILVSAAVLAVAGCTTATVTQSPASRSAGPAVAASSSPPVTSSPSATPSATAVVLAAAPARWGSRPPRPVTPGAAGHSLAAICPLVSVALEARRPSTAVKDQVYAEYGIPAGQHYLYRIDHLVPLELDGRNSIGNLWPQLVGASRAKDRLENTLHSMVCAGQITLASAQRAIRANWAHAYHRYVSTPAVPGAAPAPAPPPSPAAAPPPASCYPTAASGNCYEPGEFCSLADHGMTGVAGDGERIVCQDNNGWRWEPA
jgi:hypothetical protein